MDARRDLRYAWEAGNRLNAADAAAYAREYPRLGAETRSAPRRSGRYRLRAIARRAANAWRAWRARRAAYAALEDF